jgi:chorismate mutase
MNLQESRKKIDAIDEQIVTLLNRRASEVKQVGRIKTAAGLPLIDDAREAEIYRRVAAENFGQIETEALIRIFEQIVAESRRLQLQATTDIVEIGEAVQ